MKSINMSLKDLTIKVSEGDNLVRTITNCSVGRAGHHTPTFKGYLSYQREKMHISHKYHAPMPYALFFKDGCAFHQGDPAVASHGCIHLAASDAKWLFDWAGHDAVALEIKGPYPASPVRAH
jgi:lipoprotein-anchoring transpeptidase ErfK/SrfK